MHTFYAIIFILISDTQVWHPQPERFQTVKECVTYKAEFLEQNWQQRRLQNLWLAPWDQLERQAGFCCLMKHSGSACQTVGTVVAANQ